MAGMQGRCRLCQWAVRVCLFSASSHSQRPPLQAAHGTLPLGTKRSKSVFWQGAVEEAQPASSSEDEEEEEEERCAEACAGFPLRLPA